MDGSYSIDELKDIDVKKIHNIKTEDDVYDNLSMLERKLFYEYGKRYTYSHEEAVKAGEADFMYEEWDKRHDDGLVDSYIPDDVDLQKIIDDRIDKQERRIADIPGNMGIDALFAEVAHLTESERPGHATDLTVSLLRDLVRLNDIPYKKFMSHVTPYEGWDNNPHLKGKPLPRSWKSFWSKLDDDRYSDPEHYEYITHQIIEPWLKREYDYNPTGVKKDNPMPKSNYDGTNPDGMMKMDFFKDGGTTLKMEYQRGGEPAIQDNTFIAAIPEVIIDQASENNKKGNQELGLSNILSYIVETRGGTENLWTDLADNIAYHESGYEQRMDPKAIQRSNEYVDGKKTGNIIPGPGRGMFQFESKELNGSGSFSTAQKRYKNVAEAAKKYYIDKGLDGSGFELNENILNAKEATELSKQDQYTLFFANLIESKAVLKDYADGKLSAEDIWLKGHKNVSADGNKESFRASVKKAKELEPNGIKKGFSEFTLEDLLLYKSGGEYNIFQDYVTGNYDNTDNKKQAEKIYDKLNRIHYKEAKEAGMSPANYIMTNLMGHS